MKNGGRLGKLEQEDALGSSQGGSAEEAGLLMLEVETGSGKWVLAAPAPDSVQLHPCRHLVPWISAVLHRAGISAVLWDVRQWLQPNLGLNWGAAIRQHGPLLELFTAVCPSQAVHICAHQVPPS